MATDIYARLSRDRDEQTSTRRQIADCRKVAELRGEVVDEVHEDVDFSAYRLVVRPGLERLKARIVAGQVDTVIFWKLDRLARNVREFLGLVDLCEKHGVALVSVHEQFDTSSPLGRVLVTILAAFAELESATIGLRVRSAREYAAQAGRPRAGGMRTFGFTPQMEHVPEEAALLRDAARRIMRGESAHVIAEEWTAAGVTRPSGGAWTASGLKRQLRQPAMAGLRVHHGEVIGQGSWEPIIDRATYEALVARKKAFRPERRRYFLTGGVLRCHCGSPMSGAHVKGLTVYRCLSRAPFNGCGHNQIAAEPTEEWVKALVLAALAEPSMRAAVQRDAAGSGEEKAALDLLAGVELRMTELGSAYAKGKLPLAAFTAASEELEREAEELNRRLVRLGERSLLADAGRDLSAEWDSRDATWRHALTAALFERIVVAKAGRPRAGFDGDRLDPVPIV